jgi:hypothetical protein
LVSTSFSPSPARRDCTMTMFTHQKLVQKMGTFLSRHFFAYLKTYF